jgi:hypothetical protein
MSEEKISSAVSPTRPHEELHPTLKTAVIIVVSVVLALGILATLVMTGVIESLFQSTL